MTDQADERDLEIQRLRARVAELETAQKTQTSQLGEKLNLFGAMLETVPVGLVVADNEGRVLYGNSQIEKMLRHPVLKSADAESYGEWVSYHEDGSRVRSEEYPLAKVVNGESDHAQLEVHYERGDGTRFWMQIIGEPVFDDDGNRIGAAVACIDIDEQRKLQLAQTILIGELNHRVKNAFSVTQSIVNRTLRKAGVGHDLRLDLDKRLFAYAQAHARLVGRKWGYAPLEGVAPEVLIETIREVYPQA
ncbi:HWE histidine kinase domain-containing protein [Sphingomicrobium sp. XHP0235]|uniref:HWE histidine kinase domain-containing protein n=1 Tax=Sphingomicrobium aquimarinum TaxID=3133971 RepID=UPI0031FF24BE